MTKLEKLEQKVADTKAAYDIAYAAFVDAGTSYVKARDELEECLGRKTMAELEQLEQKVVDTEAAYVDAEAAYSAAYAAWDAYVAADNKGALAGAYAAFLHADTKAALAAAYVSFVDSEAAYIKARAELKECLKEQDND